MNKSKYGYCPKCGHVGDNNRPNKGLTFRCECCNFELHADLTAARNITLRTILSRQDWERTGALSVCPDGSSGGVQMQATWQLRSNQSSVIDFESPCIIQLLEQRAYQLI